MVIVAFDTNEKIEKQTSELLPAGEYIATLISSSLINYKNDPERQYINMKWEISEGKYAGSNVYFKLHYFHRKPSVVAWAKADLLKMCEAVGLSGLIMNTSELHGKVFNLTIGLESTPGFKDQNRILGWSKPKTTYTITTSNSASSSSVQKTDPLQNMWGNPQQ